LGLTKGGLRHPTYFLKMNKNDLLEASWKLIVSTSKDLIEGGKSLEGITFDTQRELFSLRRITAEVERKIRSIQEQSYSSGRPSYLTKETKEPKDIYNQ